MNNSEIKELVKLHEPKNSKEQRKFIAQGLRTASTLIANGLEPLKIYVTEKMKNYALGLIREDNIFLVSRKYHE